MANSTFILKLFLSIGLLALLAIPSYSEALTVKTPETLVREAFADAPIMIQISKCESHFNQFNPNGSVLRGKYNHKDVGLFQINERYWLKKSRKLGINIYTVSGNIRMARYIYNHQGVAPWGWSNNCWASMV